MSGPWAEGPERPECVLCRTARRLHGTAPLGRPVRQVEMPGVFVLQPLCAEHFVSWRALDDPDDD